MLERQYTRIDAVREPLDEMLRNCTDERIKRNGFVHLYGVGQACAFLALHRGYDRNYAEIAEITGMLHDYSKYKEKIKEGHAEKSSIEARNLLESLSVFSEEEVELICHAILVHSQKNETHDAFAEILKDADEMQHWLRNPAEEYFFSKKRTKKLVEEMKLLKML